MANFSDLTDKIDFWAEMPISKVGVNSRGILAMLDLVGVTKLSLESIT